jgi:tyrosine-protein phosphatase SIW14
VSILVASRTRLLVLVLVSPLLAQQPAQGIRNFHQVDQHVYRGGQPDKDGIEYLAKLGVRTVINLREAGPRSRQEEALVTEAGMKYINVPMTGLTPPTDAEIKKILVVLEGETSGPVFVHCKRGADRTGAVIGAYRVDYDGWDNDRALQEAMSSGMSRFQHPRQNYIRGFQRTLVSTTATPVNAAAAPASATAIAQ